MRLENRLRPRQTGTTSQPRKNRVLYLASGFGLFLLGLFSSFYLTFPDLILKQRLVHELEARLPIKVTLAEAGLRPVLTLTGKQLVVGLADQPASLFQIDTFRVAPQWISLLSGDPGLEGKINSSTGSLSFGWLRSSPVEMSGLNLPFDIPLATTPAMRCAGILTAGQVQTAAPLYKDTVSHIDITLDQVVLEGLEALSSDASALLLGRISLQMTGQGTSFAVTRLEANQGDLIVSGEGTLMLSNNNPQNSRINLNLSVRAGQQADPTLVSLLELVGTQHSDGGRKIRLAGTLAEPVLQ